jgi:hypothetical protein
MRRIGGDNIFYRSDVVLVGRCPIIHLLTLRNERVRMNSITVTYNKQSVPRANRKFLSWGVLSIDQASVRVVVTMMVVLFVV